MSTIEEKRRQHILEQIEGMAGGISSPERGQRGQAGQDLGTKQRPKSDRTTDEELQAYAQAFLYPECFQNKISCSLNRHTVERLRYILSQVPENVSLAAYIDHILWAHLREHQEVLNKVIERNHCKNIISDKL